MEGPLTNCKDTQSGAVGRLMPWMVDLAQDLQRLAERNGVKSGNKHDILKRLVTFMQGE